MAEDETGAAMRRYFDALGTDRYVDAVQPDVTWTVEATGLVITGVEAVSAHLDALHGAMGETHTRRLAIARDSAFLEGDCADPRLPDDRIPYCVAYDIGDGRVAAMRLYGSLESAFDIG